MKPAWTPDEDVIRTSNLKLLMSETNCEDVKHFHQWSVENYPDFWNKILNKLTIKFKKSPQKIVDVSQGIEKPKWFPGSEINITDSCFQSSPDAVAIICQDVNKKLQQMTYLELGMLTNQIANSLVQAGFKKGDAIGIAMPMNQYAVAIYLGIIKMGGVVVSIADSFSSQEMAVRLKIAKAKAVFTQDILQWTGKNLPLYTKVRDAADSLPQTNIKLFVIPNDKKLAIELIKEDQSWQEFLCDNTEFSSVGCDPMTPCNILFSSGTTAEPKAIVWNHTTGIKAASDAYLHQNIKPGDVLAWPTNLGWMMGPWLIYAALINRATIALYPDAPKDRVFGEFVQNAKVTMLGVVPTLVAAWRQSHCMEGLDWRSIKVFTSTGECSNPEDMLYLMSLAGYKPVIEYCGGTEIGGAYISSTVIQDNYPSLFTTPAFGLDFAIIDEEGNSTNMGEVAIIPPSVGLSTELLNADHHQIYFANMPLSPTGKVMRRHGDQIKRLENNLFSVIGRVDDAMNLGGIKVSSAEIERALVGINDIAETAAIAISPPDNGPSQLIIYAVVNSMVDKKTIMQAMQKKINAELNPLFKISDVVFVNELPKTASNKIMRRILRKKYTEIH